jgi:hypothetical protein
VVLHHEAQNTTAGRYLVLLEATWRSPKSSKLPQKTLEAQCADSFQQAHTMAKKEVMCSQVLNSHSHDFTDIYKPTRPQA